MVSGKLFSNTVILRYLKTGLPHPGKVLESPRFFFCLGKSLNFVYKSWKKFGKFSRNLPGQNVKFFCCCDNWYLVIAQKYC